MDRQAVWRELWRSIGNHIRVRPAPGSFQEWVVYLFDRPVSKPQWYYSGNETIWEPSPTVAVDYVINLFQNAGTILAPYSDAQVDQGLIYIIHQMGTGYMDVIVRNDEKGSNELPWLLRQKAIQSICTLYEQCFFYRCSQNLAHTGEKGGTPLNHVCYMWWDIFPCLGQPEQSQYAQRDNELLAVMEKILHINHDACRESALRGLGHWAKDYPQRTAKIIDCFLNSPEAGKIPFKLAQYAALARWGYVL